MLKVFLVKEPATDADDRDAEKSNDENGETTFGEAAHALARRRIINGRGLVRRDGCRGRRRWRRRLTIHEESELVGCAKTFKLLKEKERDSRVAPPWGRVSPRKVRRDFWNPSL